MSKKVLIVGGVAGGASAAARLRRLDEDAEIVLFERDAYISFANCGLPYYIGDAIKDRSKLLVQTPEAMRSRFRLDVRTESEVVSIDPVGKTVKVRSRERGDYTESYDALILSPGAKPVRPNLPGIGSPLIHSLRNIPDTDRIKQKVMEQGTQSAVVIGGGFIGVEMAENLREIGINVTLVEGGSQILAPFDADMAGALTKELEENGVKVLLAQTVTAFQENAGGQITVQLGSGLSLVSDIAILAIGVAPDTSFLKDSGLLLGPRGHIQVDDYLMTNLEDVYAVGDAVEITDFVNGSKAAIPLAGPANKQGRIAADNVCGLRTAYKGSQGTSIIKVFSLTGAATGNNEKTLQRLGIPYRVSIVHPSSHASYYPGSSPMTLKLLFGNDGKALGAQGIGVKGVDKRIDDLATVIRFRGAVSDLTELELAYAPPFSSAKDPVNMAGYAAENILYGRTSVYLPVDLKERDPQTTLLVDVRSELEHANGHIPNSINIPVDDLRGRLNELDSTKEIWVYCQVGLRGYTASRILQQKGFRVRNLTGGYRTYQMAVYQPGQGDEGSLQLGSSVFSAGAERQIVAAVESGSSRETATVCSLADASAAQGLTGEIAADFELDACGLCCPGPLVQVKQRMEEMKAGQVLRVTASDPGFYRDIEAWAGMARQELLRVSKNPDGVIEAYLRKRGLDAAPASAVPAVSEATPEGSTMVVFSGDLDKAIASFIIANGAAASGKKVTLFFTFWGLNIIRKTGKVRVSKSFIGRMFGQMMPRGSRKLGLSRMNLLGMGPKMIRGVMKSRNVSSLEELIDTAIKQGVELVACQMSMDVMGIQQEELLDGVQVAGVGYYLGKADRSSVNLFI
ncbi:DsrE/DsrF/DrsH-like family protein [Gorillibacterium timonense]|uniref:DsrE/DsrF/DrsH-like family protein n=1 Tax=Gorillibacterium timonense TaxID=1689269 RepID=UPI00071DCEDD|nr:DsrE/DsrF/DrsH-like family protein [Gorillibacterium timonense]